MACIPALREMERRTWSGDDGVIMKIKADVAFFFRGVLWVKKRSDAQTNQQLTKASLCAALRRK